ncbi:MAG: glycosyltransferase [Planctomycetaceae bacterium]|nr:glycosyltransferase [Planctomycetaceae bacterium]
MVALWTLFAASTFLLYWIYDGYGRFLHLAVTVRNLTGHAGRKPQESEEGQGTSDPGKLPSITALLTVHNEQDTVERTLRNLLACDYPPDRLRIVVASDGSTDATNSIVQEMHHPQIALFTSPGLGKTATQNMAVRDIESDILLFVDADISFEPQFLKSVARSFAAPEVGAVDGRLLYPSRGGSAEVEGQGFYWKYELRLRDLESRLGILAVMTGACMSIRRELFVEMDPSIGEDCIVPLDIVQQGYRVIHATSAQAVDRFEDGLGVTLRRRIRMTLRNWQGTWTRPSLLNPFRYPRIAFALWSHKLLRWLSPVFLLCAVAASLAMVILSPSLITLAAFAPYATLLGMAGCGWIASRAGRRIPMTGTAFTFLLANIAFLVGVLGAIRGQRIRSYRNV